MVVVSASESDTLPSRNFHRLLGSSYRIPGPALPARSLHVMTCCSGPLVVVRAHASNVNPFDHVLGASRASEFAKNPPVLALSRKMPSNLIDRSANGPGWLSRGAGRPRSVPLCLPVSERVEAKRQYAIGLSLMTALR